MTNNHILPYINSLPIDITFLDLSNKNIRGVLPDLSRFTNLKKLDVSNNQLRAIFDLNDSIKELNCSNNELRVICKLNNNLKILNCSNNELRQLPEFNEKLKIVDCSYNELEILPTLNNKLKELYCHYNELKYLPQFNKNLRIIYCFCNNLEYLPPFNNKLKIINCKLNEILILPIITNYNIDIFFDGITTIYYKYLIYSEFENNNHKRNYNIINKINNFRYTYYFGKYGRKIFYNLLKLKIKKYKDKLLEKSAIITMRPNRINRLLENGELSLDDINEWII